MMRVLVWVLGLALAAAAPAQDASAEIAEWQRRVEKDPKDVAAREALFRAYARRGNIEAVFQMGKLVELQPERAEELAKELERMMPSPTPSAAADPQALEKARAAYDAGRFDDVRALLEPISQRGDFPESAKYMLGMSYCKLHDQMNAMMMLMSMRRPLDKLGFELEAEVKRVQRSSLRGMGAPGPDAKADIHQAAIGGDVESVRAILAARPGAWKDLDPLGRPVLPRAAGAGHLAVVKALVEAGADVNAVEGDGMVAMSALETAEQAVRMRLISPEIVTYLKSKGANNHASACARNRDRIQWAVFTHNNFALGTETPLIVDRLDLDAMVAKKSLKPDQAKCPGGGMYRAIPDPKSRLELGIECSVHGVTRPRTR